MHQKNVKTSGKKIEDARKALVMLHGRGSTSEDILGLADYLSTDDFALVAPQATNFTWYPYSFLVPPQQNEPWLSSALELLGGIVADLNHAGIDDENVYFAGFSQGACLTLEFVARNARRWGGVAAFTGGLVGDRIYAENYSGDFRKTPIFIGSGDPDAHVPAERVRDSTRILKAMNASMMEKIYPGMGHTISDQEIARANDWVFNPAKS